MQTWLDWYVSLLGEQASAAERANGRKLGLFDHEVFAYETAEAFRLIVGKNTEYESSDKYDFGWFLTRLAPFAGHIFEKPPYAAQADAGSVADLRGAPISDGIRVLARSVRHRHEVAYIDVPDGAYPLRGDLQLRALFIWKTDVGEHFCAVVTRPGSNHGRRFAWSEGLHARNAADSRFDQVWPMASKDCKRKNCDIDARVFDYSQLAEIEDFAWLTLAYLEIEHENGANHVQRLPRIVGDDPRRCGRKSRQFAKKYSLFSVVKVSTRNLDRAPSMEGSRKGHTKRRHRVRGHFKLQSYGPKWSLRRLKWWPEHQRGSGHAPPPIPLHVIRTPNGIHDHAPL